MVPAALLLLVPTLLDAANVDELGDLVRWLALAAAGGDPCSAGSAAPSARTGAAAVSPPSPVVSDPGGLLALPEVTERPSHGAPTWFVRNKTAFATFWEHGHHDTCSSHTVAGRRDRASRPS
jgi:hypothetical protein